MPFKLIFTDRAEANLKRLASNPAFAKRLKAVHKALGFLEENPRHPALRTHKYKGITGNNGEEIFEAYAENNTPAAYRIFWHYGPEKGMITIIAITAHPQ